MPPPDRPEGDRTAGPEDFAHGSVLPAGDVVAAQLGQTLDGRIATISGESRYINGACALDHLHRLRADVDAVLVGAGTVAADDPQLTVRRVPGSDPVRVILDPNARVDARARCLDPSHGPAIVLRRGNIERRLAGAGPQGSDLLEIPAPDGQLAPARIISALARHNLRRILVEGGARTISGFLDAGVIDRLHILMAPIIIGSGRTGIELKPNGALSKALRPATTVRLFADGDVLFDCDMRQRRDKEAGDAERSATGALCRRGEMGSLDHGA